MEVVLDGKVAVVTGAGGAIGRAIAEGLAAAGALVACADVAEEAAQSTAESIRAAGGRASAHRLDVASEPDVERFIESVAGERGGLDVVCNVAGVHVVKPVAEVSVQEWDRVMAVNLRGTFLVSRASIPHLARRGSGRIIQVASSRGIHGQQNAAAYAASKGGVIAFTRSLAMEVAPLGITVNAIAPGGTDTPMWRSGLSQEAAEAARRAGKVGRPGDLVPAVVFLASDLAGQITGHLLVRDIYMPQAPTEGA